MIKATELRIGNVIRFADRKHTYPINSAEDLVMVENNEEAYEGIPLTPEVLINAGFEERGDFFVFDYWRWVNGFLQFETSDNYETAYYQIPGRYLSVHHLQNVYYALTSKELEIRL